MTDTAIRRGNSVGLPPRLTRALDRRAESLYKGQPPSSYKGQPPSSFCVEAPNGDRHIVGTEPPAFTIRVNDAAGARAVSSLDRFAVAMAYLDGHIDLQGDMLAALKMRGFFSDFHPIAFLGRWLPTLFLGRIRHDNKAISRHYDEDPEFFLSFMDSRHHCYTQGVFASDDESLEDAMTRKLDLAISMLGVRPGDHVLEVGGGWGAFAAHAARQGVAVTTLTLSKKSEQFLNDLASTDNLPITVVRRHFLDYTSQQRFDAIVNMGTTEHIPDYRASIRKYAELTKPGGHVYLDALAMRRKHRTSTFMKSQIYPGRSAPLLLHSYLKEVARSPFELLTVIDDRHNYFLTCREWARRLDAAKDFIIDRFGAPVYRRFRLFLWGSAAGFDTGLVQAYRWVLRMPTTASA